MNAFPASMQRIAHQRDLAESAVRDVRQKATDVTEAKDAYTVSARDMNAWLDVVAIALVKGDHADKTKLHEKSGAAARSLLTYINVAQSVMGKARRSRLMRHASSGWASNSKMPGLELSRVSPRELSREELVRSLELQVRWREWDAIQ